MAKRDTDTEIWDEDWFLDLKGQKMLFWFYIKDRCDHAGFWRPNFKRFEKDTGFRINVKDFLEKINEVGHERVKVLDNGKWFITGFIAFHFNGKLNLNNNFHRSIYDTFRKNVPDENTMTYRFEVVETSRRGQGEVKETSGRTENKEQRKEKKEEVQGKEENQSKQEKSPFEIFWQTYPKKRGKGAAEKAWLKIKNPIEILKKILTALSWQKKSFDWKKEDGQYIPMPSTYLNQRRWEDEPPARDGESVKKDENKLPPPEERMTELDGKQATQLFKEVTGKIKSV